jgi:hypothetical protein
MWIEYVDSITTSNRQLDVVELLPGRALFSVACIDYRDNDLTRRSGSRTLPDAPMTTYGYIDGVLRRTAFVAGARGVGIRLGAAALDLGDHPIPDRW